MPNIELRRNVWYATLHVPADARLAIGKGKVFYFRPGHEQYPVFKQPEMIQILSNACRWLGGVQ